MTGSGKCFVLVISKRFLFCFIVLPKPFGLSCGLFLKADNTFFNSHDLAVPGLPALLIMMYLNSLYLKLVFTLYSSVLQQSNVSAVLVCSDVACQCFRFTCKDENHTPFLPGFCFYS